MKKFDEIIGAALKDVTKSISTYVAAESDSEFLKIEAISLIFDRGVLLIENPFMIINSENENIKINELVGDSVRTAYLLESEIQILFESDTMLTISLRDEDFVGPEAASWTPNDGAIIVFN